MGVGALVIDPAGSVTDFVGVAPWSDLASLDSPVWTSTRALLPTGDILQTLSTSATTYAGMLRARA
jgi:hypothetical protein